MKKIGLLTDFSDGKVVFNLAYFKFAQQFGAVDFVLPHSEAIKDFDLLILPGGQDVHPLRYGQVKVPWLCGSQNESFEYFDQVALPSYIEKGTPIFGICRGLQTLNVHFGGSLHQHVDEPTSSADRGAPAHSAFDTKTNLCYRVNSLHHQAIDQLGEGLEVSLQGYKKVKGKGESRMINLCIEGIRHKTFPIAAVQFHPEELCVNETVPTTQWVNKEVQRIMQWKFENVLTVEQAEETRLVLAQ
jgi:putative glutamine amidotransferase